MKLRTLIPLLAVLLAGCPPAPYVAQPSATPTAVAPVTVATDKETAATEKADAAKQTQLDAMTKVAGQVKANVAMASDANAGNPAGAPKTIVAGETGLALDKLQGVPADPVEVQAAKDRRALVESGKVQEAQAAYADAATKSLALSQEVGRQKALADQALLDRDKARAETKAAVDQYVKDAEAARVAHETEIKELNAKQAAELAKARSAEASKQALYLRIGAGACLLIFGLGVGFLQLAGLKIVWPFGLFCLLLLGLAQLVTQPWFEYAIAGCLAIIGVAVAAWLWYHNKEKNLAAAIAQKATAMTAVVKDVVPVLDTAYNDAEPTVQNWLDAHIFTPLSSKMDASVKATVHTVRAELADPAPAAPVATTAPATTVTS